MDASDLNKRRYYMPEQSHQWIDQLALIYHKRGVFGLTKRDGSVNKSALLQYLIEEAAKREGLIEVVEVKSSE